MFYPTIGRCHRNSFYRPHRPYYCRPYYRPLFPIIFPSTSVTVDKSPQQTVYHYTPPPAEASYKEAFVALGIFTTLLASAAAFALFNKK